MGQPRDAGDLSRSTVRMGATQGKQGKFQQWRMVMGKSETDVVVIGGGIAGSALGATLARRGVRVTVLERTREFPDRVRGEMWTPWGVSNLQTLDLLDTLLDAGAIFTTRWVFYDAAIPTPVAEELAVDLSTLVPGVPGILNIGHPAACNALFGAATAAGATMHRGIVSTEIVSDGPRHTVRWTADDDTAGEVTAGLLVGADGRASAVRKHLGIELHSAPVRQYMTGLLVEGPEPLSMHVDCYGTGRDVNWYSFPQGPRTSRVYLAHLDVHRYSGREGTAGFLQDLAQAASPDVAMLSCGRAISSLATHPSVDTWTEVPFRPGAVLVGDSAGYNDPIIGQGLSLAMADVRDVSGLVLEEGLDADFTPYGTARLDRHAKQRMAAQTMAELMCSFGEEDAGRRLRALPLLGTDETVMALGASMLAGPEVLPPGTAPLEAAREIMLAA
jgi:2-polyprenyl-6-methoxyphenol hydroxylase-like FAD-dependent oxidoreductase